MSVKTTIDILRGARQLLVEKGWTQDAFARDAEGGEIGENHPAAACFCAWGALIAVERYDYDAAYKALQREVGGNIPIFNDAEGRTVDEVLAKFDAAIAAEEARLVP